MSANQGGLNLVSASSTISAGLEVREFGSKLVDLMARAVLAGLKAQAVKEMAEIVEGNVFIALSAHHFFKSLIGLPHAKKNPR